MSTPRPENQRQLLEAYHHTEDNRYIWTAVYLTLAIISLAIYYLFKQKILGELWEHRIWALRLSFAASLGFGVLGASRWIESRIRKNAQSPASRYNLIRFIRLVAGGCTILVLATAMFQNWYTAVMSLGLLSVILGFALQFPIASFVGWIYIIFRHPYKVGDRILIDEYRGEVFDIGYLDTGIREFSGQKFSADVPTGRLVRFPNNLVLSKAIVNYRWNQFPFIWNETTVYLREGSDLKPIESILRDATKLVLGPEMAQEVEDLKRRPSIRSEEFESYPFVNFSFEANGRVKATVLYLVEPRKAAAVRNSILMEMTRNRSEASHDPALSESNQV